jgi:hypothetical protein
MWIKPRPQPLPSQTAAQRITASQGAAAIIEQFVMALPEQDETQA